MRLISLRLHNFRQHADTEIEFRTGLTGVIGPNGAGKSTLLEAIAWALYGSAAARGTNETIRFARAPGGSQVRVELVFGLGGHEFRVVRSMSNAEVFLDGGESPVASSIGGATEYLERRLGMSRDEFFNTYFTGQNELQFLARMGSAQRGRFLSQVLGYERLRVAQESARVRRNELRHERDGLRAGLPDPGELEAELRAAERRRAEALDAVEAIELEIDDLPAVSDPETALAGDAPELHAEAPGNLAYRWECGDAAAVEAEFSEAAQIVSTPFLNQRIVVASMEPRAINIRYDPDEARWEGWVGSQGAHGMRALIARSLGVAKDRVRVHVPDVGGGFGMKLMNHPEYGLCALAAQALGRPVKWIGDRSESFLSDAQGRDLRGAVEGAFDADGRCRAMRMRTVSGLGAYYSTYGAAIHTQFSAPLLGGMYAVRQIHAEVRGVFTNTTPTDAYRGAGRPETIYATERLMDAAADALGLDAAGIRRRNLVTP
ncbi:MAG: molybdopterin cofactor-binding domain-containing protein, partial [Gemmatimonadota bacterium]